MVVQVSPKDDLLIRNFRTLAFPFIRQLNRDLSLHFDASRFERCRAYFNRERRDPTVGELRLLDGLFCLNETSPARTAVDSLFTDSDTLASVWADMMDKHRYLVNDRTGGFSDGRGTTDPSPTADLPPLPADEALSLIRRVFLQTGIRTDPPICHRQVRLLTSPEEEAEAAGDGFRVVSRFVTGDGTFRFCIRQGNGQTAVPSRIGDILLLLRNMPSESMEQFLSRPDLAKIPLAVRAVTRNGRLMTALELCDSIDIYAHRLPALDSTPEHPRSAVQDGRVDFSGLADRISADSISPDGKRADFLVRVPVASVNRITQILCVYGINAVIFGQVGSGADVVIRTHGEVGSRETPAIRLKSAFLRQCAEPTRYRFCLSDKPDGQPACVRFSPSALYPVDGKNGVPVGTFPADRFCPLSFTVPASPILMVTSRKNGLLFPTVTVTASADSSGQGYRMGLEALLSAAKELASAGANRRMLKASVVLTTFETPDGPDHPVRIGSLGWETILGLYRGFSEWNILPDRTDIRNGNPAEGRTVNGRHEAVRLTVSVYATALIESDADEKSLSPVSSPAHGQDRPARPKKHNRKTRPESETEPDSAESHPQSETGSDSAKTEPEIGVFLPMAEIRNRLDRLAEASVCRPEPDRNQWDTALTGTGHEQLHIAIPFLTNAARTNRQAPDPRSLHLSQALCAAFTDANPAGRVLCTICPLRVETVTQTVPLPSENAPMTDNPVSGTPDVPVRDTDSDAGKETEPVGQADSGLDLSPVTLPPEMPVPSTVTMHRIAPESIAGLEREAADSVLVLALDDDDAAVLFGDSAMTDVLARHVADHLPLAGIGPVCTGLARHGFLHPDLSEPPCSLPVSDDEEVTVRHRFAPGMTVHRLLTHPLLRAVGTRDDGTAARLSFLTLTCADGTELNDGFMDGNGLTVALYNGLDVPTARHLTDTWVALLAETSSRLTDVPPEAEGAETIPPDTL